MATAVRKTQKRTIKPDLPSPEVIVNDAPRIFTEADFPVGTVAHQGDLVLVRIAGMPQSGKPRQDRQLAAGNTQGSRHVLETGLPYDCAASDVANAIAAVCPGVAVQAAYIGPVFATRGGAADLLHPEHGDHHYRGEMVLAVVYQRNLDAEEREQRVQD
jgi:hypothetical protein